ncbi:hypothetical protein CSHISOI_06606, partial [Colletotrichum shisoi]
ERVGVEGRRERASPPVLPGGQPPSSTSTLRTSSTTTEATPHARVERITQPIVTHGRRTLGLTAAAPRTAQSSFTIFPDTKQPTDPASSLSFGKPPSTSAQAAAMSWRPSSPVARPVPAPPLHRPYTRTHADDTITDRSRSRNSSSPDVRCQIACQITLCSSSRRTTRTFSHTHTHISIQALLRHKTPMPCPATQHNAPSGRSLPHRTRYCGYARRLDARPSTADVCRSATRGLYPDRWAPCLVPHDNLIRDIRRFSPSPPWFSHGGEDPGGCGPVKSTQGRLCLSA